MTTRSLLRIGILITTIMPAACMGGVGAPSSSDSVSVGAWVTSNFIPPSQQRAKRATPDLFLADVNSNVLVYTANIGQTNPPLLEEITQGVSRSTGVAIDRRGTLYVLNFGGSTIDIAEYKRGATSPFKTITNGLGYPADVVVDRAENLYVDENDGSRGSFVAVYPKGATSPKRMIALPANGRFEPAGMAVDPKEDLLVDMFDVEDNAAVVYSIAAGSSQANNLNLQSPPGPSLGADRSGNIYVGDSAGYIAIYPPGGTSPTRTLDLNEGGFYTAMTVTANGTIYWPNYDEGAMYEVAPGASGATNVFSTAGSGFAAAVGPQ